MMTRKILILGATSAIARATANALAKQGDELLLAGRDVSELERIASDLSVRFDNQNHVLKFDIENSTQHKPFFQEAIQKLGDLTGVVFAIGYMNKDIEKTLQINFTSAVSILNVCAAYLEQQKKGFILGITSVAGDRGRQSNYIYGAAKGGLSIYLQGLRNRLFKSNVRVITIKPGFVDTAMTFGLPVLFLVAQPQIVGDVIVRSIDKNTDVLYVPGFWRLIMFIIVHIPEKIFKRLSL
jgi:decaprenylphospho-beta-D-erythro-pentofuranosid-2-ulose 2-reductase